MIRSVRLLNIILIAGIAVDLVGSLLLLAVFASPLASLVPNFLLAVMMIASWGLMRIRRVMLACNVLIVAVWIYTTIASYLFGGMTSPVMSTMLVLIVVAGVLLGQWGTFLAMGLVLVSSLGLLYLEAIHQLPSPLMKIGSGVTFIVLAAQALVLVAVVYLTSQNMRNALNRMQRQVAERIQIENSLREREQQLRTIYDNTTVGITLSTPEGRYIFCNSAFANMLGYSPPELNYLTFEQITHSDDVLKERELRAQIERGEIDSYQLEKRYRTKHAQDLWMRVNVSCQRDERGKVKFFTGIVEDITQRKRAEQDLSKFRLGIERSGDAVMMTDHDGVIFYVNPAFTHIYGYTQAEALGKTPRLLRSGRVAMQEYELLWNRLLKKFAFSNEMINLTKSGQLVHIESSANPIIGDNGEILGFLAIHRNISERKQAEQEREQLIKELETKNAELERFTYTVSHDLKSPLITIAGFLAFLEKDAQAGNVARIKTDLLRISNAVEKMKRLLDEVLELSRIGRLINAPEPVSFENLVQESLSLVQGRIQARDVQIRVQPNLPYVHGDHARLVEVMQNLIDNAIKFMGNQTEPCIEIGMQPGDASSSGTFFVRDNGMGISPQYHHRVFGLFNKLDPGSEGTGVGLALVKRIVEVHGGRIWVESDGEFAGTCFYFTLPLAPTRLAQPIE
jgi:PAS domain S-box-containing protein